MRNLENWKRLRIDVAVTFSATITVPFAYERKLLTDFVTKQHSVVTSEEMKVGPDFRTLKENKKVNEKNRN